MPWAIEGVFSSSPTGIPTGFIIYERGKGHIWKSVCFQVTAQTISVLPPLPLAGPYDYIVPEGISVQFGDFVEIPLGRQTQRGVVWGDAKGDVEPSKLREIYGVLPAEPMPDVTRKFIDWVSAYTMARCCAWP